MSGSPDIGALGASRTVAGPAAAASILRDPRAPGCILLAGINGARSSG